MKSVSREPKAENDASKCLFGMKFEVLNIPTRVFGVPSLNKDKTKELNRPNQH